MFFALNNYNILYIICVCIDNRIYIELFVSCAVDQLLPFPRKIITHAPLTTARMYLRFRWLATLSRIDENVKWWRHINTFRFLTRRENSTRVRSRTSECARTYSVLCDNPRLNIILADFITSLNRLYYYTHYRRNCFPNTRRVSTVLVFRSNTIYGVRVLRPLYNCKRKSCKNQDDKYYDPRITYDGR